MSHLNNNISRKKKKKNILALQRISAPITLLTERYLQFRLRLILKSTYVWLLLLTYKINYKYI